MIFFSAFLIVFAVLQCKPVSALLEKQCNMRQCGHGQGYLCAFGDYSCNRLDSWCLAHFHHLGFRTKFYIGLVLALGSCACIATLPRFAYIGYLKDPRDIFFHTGLIIWSHSEVGISLTASSVATLRPLFTHLRGMCCTGHGQSEKSDRRNLEEHRLPVEECIEPTESQEYAGFPV